VSTAEPNRAIVGPCGVCCVSFKFRFDECLGRRPTGGALGRRGARRAKCHALNGNRWLWFGRSPGARPSDGVQWGTQNGADGRGGM
jgi:hypothetical protein